MEECPICMENLQFNNRKIHTTACKHSFHGMCIKKVKMCPCCRAVLDDSVSKIAKIKDEIKELNAKFISYKRCGKRILKTHKKLARSSALLLKKRKSSNKDFERWGLD
jgi:hypothetical protein